MKVFDDAMRAIKKQMHHHSKLSNYLYIAEVKGGKVAHKMGHLVIDTRNEHPSLVAACKFPHP